MHSCTERGRHVANAAHSGAVSLSCLFLSLLLVDDVPRFWRRRPASIVDVGVSFGLQKGLAAAGAAATLSEEDDWRALVFWQRGRKRLVISKVPRHAASWTRLRRNLLVGTKVDGRRTSFFHSGLQLRRCE